MKTGKDYVATRSMLKKVKNDQRLRVAGLQPIYLSPNHKRILAHILKRFLEERTCTRRELVRLIGASSPCAVDKHLDHLRDAGLITWEDGLNRTIRPCVFFITPEELLS